MSYVRDLKALTDAGSEGLSDVEAHRLFGALLDGGVPDLELGAILTALSARRESIAELLGFYSAMDERAFRMHAPPGRPLPVVLPSYGGAIDQPNLLPLLAMLLNRFGVPVLVHGELTSDGRIASAYIFRELGVLPCASALHAQQELDHGHVAFIPTRAMAPGVATLLALRARLGVRSSAHLLVKLTDPFDTKCLRVVSATRPEDLDLLREFLLASAAHALLLRSCEGEPFADPHQRPRMELISDGGTEMLFEAERDGPREILRHDAEVRAVATAQWTRRALAGEVPTPQPILNQLACCLYAAGYCEDINQAKAIVAVESRSHVAA
jgi:anthranilate phosphoribosyltransferase